MNAFALVCEEGKESREPNSVTEPQGSDSEASSEFSNEECGFLLVRALICLGRTSHHAVGYRQAK